MFNKIKDLFSDNSQTVFWYTLAIVTMLISAFFTHNFVSTFWTFSLPKFFGFDIAVTYLLGLVTSFITTLIGITLRDINKTKSIISAGQNSDNWVANILCQGYTLIGIAFIVLVFYGLDWMSTMEGLALKNGTTTFPLISILNWNQVVAGIMVFGSDAFVAMAHIASGKGGSPSGRPSK